MDFEPLTASSQSLLPQVLARMAAQTAAPEIGYVLVLHRRQVRGVATGQDLLQAIAQQPNWSRLRLGQVISRPVATVSQSALQTGPVAATAVLDQFERHRLAQLPVVDQRKQLVGVIERTRLLQALYAQGAAAQLRRRHRRHARGRRGRGAVHQGADG
ncbi:MAG: CBS domain-containing protein, partial [Leptolyngbya sp. SIO4C1]|nr:CBS domain-containing protein [Leptolyngbya sp. SIO4C1]